MTWRPPDTALTARFDALCPGAPVERHTVFGCPTAFVNGNMFFGATSDGLWVRLGEADREELSMKRGSKAVEPAPGRPMKGYLLMPPDWPDEAMAEWVVRALRHAETLVPTRPRR